LASSQQYIEANKLSDHGINVSTLHFDLSKMMERKNEIVSQLTSGVSSLFKANKVHSVRGLAKVINSKTIEVTHNGKSEIIKTKNIIIATGSSPIDLPIASVFQENIEDSAGALEFESIPSKLAIVGAGIIGLELGSVWARLGAEVTIIEVEDEFLPKVDKRIGRDVLKTLKTQGLNISLGSEVIEATSNSKGVKVIYRKKDDLLDIQVDKLIVAIGRKPNTANLFDKDCELVIDENGYILVNDVCETTIDSIFAIGDVVRGPMLAHKASEEGIMVAERIAGNNMDLNYDLIPSVIYIHPEVAWVGRGEEELKKEKIDYITGTFPFAANGRALTSGESTGFVKIISDKGTDKILGVHVFGPSAADIVQQAIIAMNFGSTAEQLGSTIFSHPTVSEALHEAALAVNRKAIHIGNRN
jgi:dihydrolipoamide dehydrogenase